MTTRAGNIQFLLSGMTSSTTGEPVAAGTVEFYEAGTTTAKNVWTEIEKTNAYTTYDLDAVGAAQLYGEGNYKIVIKDAADATVATLDNIRIEYPYYGIRTVTASPVTMLSQDDFILCNTTSGAIEIDCLAAASWLRPLKIMRIAGNNNITVDPNGAETIDSNSTLTISSDAITEIISDGSNLRSAGFRSSFTDADDDTKIQVEESIDEDVIRFDAGGTNDVMRIYGSGSHNVYMSGGLRVLAGDVQIDQNKVFVGGGLTDTDGDTKVQVEESADEDIIRFDISGVEQMNLDSTDLTVNLPVVAGSSNDFASLNNAGHVEICDSGGSPLINFKTASGESYDARIAQDSNGLTFHTGGDGSTAQALNINSSQNAIFAGNIQASGGFVDADADTKIQVEESADEDIVRIDAGGTPNVMEVHASGTHTVYVSGGFRVQGGDIQTGQAQVFIGGGLTDTDGDTKVQVEETDDEDVIRFDAGGTENLLHVHPSGTYTVYVSGGLQVESSGAKIASGTLEVTNDCDFNGNVDIAETLTLSKTSGNALVVAADCDFNGDMDVAGTTNLDTTDIDGTLDVSSTLDIGASTTRRVAPTGKFVDNSNGNPNISDTVFAVDSGLTESTWESIGHTTSGADNTWAALDDIPTDSDYAIIRVVTVCTETSGASGSLYTRTYVRENGSSESIADANLIASVGDFGDSNGDGYGNDVSIHQVPLNSRVFDAYWVSTFTTNIDIDLYLVGWGINP